MSGTRGNLGRNACQTLETLAIGSRERERHQGGVALDDFETKLASDPVAERRSAHLGDRQPSARDHQRPGLPAFTRRFDTKSRSDARDRAPGDQPDSGALALDLQHAYD